MDAGLTPAWWSDARLHVVSGKGGTGKTTVAAALAIALATGGRRTLLVEVEGRQSIAQLFNIPPLPYGERPIAAAPGGGVVEGLAVEPDEALVDYLDMFYGMRRAGGMLRKVGAIDFATAVAPGLRDVLLTGKVKEATTRVRDSKRVYDAVVLDAPPTGRIARFLNVTGEVAQLTKVGPIKKQSDGVMALLRSSTTAIHLVTLLEEMPVQETIEGSAELAASGLEVASVLINMATEPQMSAGELDEIAGGLDPAAGIAAGLAEAGADPAYAGPLAAELREYAERFTQEQQARAALPGLGVPLIELPRLASRIGPERLNQLAVMIREQVGEEVVHGG